MRDFKEIESLFSVLLDKARAQLSDTECAEIQEYVDVGEYGLALKTTIAIYVEENKVATVEIEDLLTRLAQAMSIESKTLLSRLPKHGKV